MSTPINAAAPGPGVPRGNEVHRGAGTTTILASAAHAGPRDTTPLPVIDAATVDEHLGGVLVLLVRTHASRYRRRVFLSVAAAQRAADRALQAGHAAEVVLCRLHPVGAVL